MYGAYLAQLLQRGTSVVGDLHQKLGVGCERALVAGYNLAEYVLRTQEPMRTGRLTVTPGKSGNACWWLMGSL